MESIRVKLFARFAELLQRDELTVPLSSPATVRDLRAKLRTDYPVLQPLLEVSRFAVNEDFAEESQTLHSADEVAIIPPVSGG